MFILPMIQVVLGNMDIYHINYSNYDMGRQKNSAAMDQNDGMANGSKANNKR